MLCVLQLNRDLLNLETGLKSIDVVVTAAATNSATVLCKFMCDCTFVNPYVYSAR